MKGSEGFDSFENIPYVLSPKEKTAFEEYETSLIETAIAESGISPDEIEKTIAFIEEWIKNHREETLRTFLADRRQN
jgi:hypothetical protein